MPRSRPTHGVARRAILACSLLAAASTALAQPVPRQAPPDPLLQLNESIDALTRKVWPSVVQILVSSFGPQEGPGGPRRSSDGSSRLARAS